MNQCLKMLMRFGKAAEMATSGQYARITAEIRPWMLLTVFGEQVSAFSLMSDCTLSSVSDESGTLASGVRCAFKML